MISNARIPSLFLTDVSASQKNLRSLLIVGLGVLGLSILAQVKIPLPFSPVPVTGQTFGVTLLALLYGRKLGAATVLSYVGLGAVGVPVFASLQSGLGGPTTGYLLGMVLASLVMGLLADRGWSQSFKKAWVAGFCGDLCIFAVGLLGLSFYVPASALWTAGLLPFIPGNLIKTTLAASMASSFRQTSKKS